MTINELLAMWEESGHTPTVDKYSAVTPSVIASIARRLDETDRNAADLVRWLMWWYQFHLNCLKWREDEIARLLAERKPAEEGENWEEYLARRAAKPE